MKIQIKSVFGRIIFEYETENNTLKKTVEKAVERSADLSSADLRSADLSSANLSSADLSSADLSSANLDKRYIQVSCIGSVKRNTTYCFDDDIIWCGCFKGTLDEFEFRVNKRHKNNHQYLKEYLGFVNYLKNLK